MTITPREQSEIEAANGSAKQPVVFIHGLWLLAGSWDPWRRYFEERGFSTLAVDWPGDPSTVKEARANPDVFAGTSVGQVADHVAEVIGQLRRQPAVIGHSFGGLFAQITAGRGLSVGSVAIDPAPFRGVLPLPISALRASFPVLGNPLNAKRAVTLTEKQFTYGFANAVSAEEAHRLYDEHHVAAPGKPLFQAATANLNPGTEAKVDTQNPERGPLLVISGGKDNIVPWALANAAYKRQKRNERNVTEITEIDGVGHSLVIDAGWPKVAETAHDFLTSQGVTAG